MRCVAVIGVFLLAVPAFGLTAVIRPGGQATCQNFSLQNELKVFRDRTLLEPEITRLREGSAEVNDQESPVIGSLKGTVSLQLLGASSPFRGFDALVGLYGLGPDYEERVLGRSPQIIPVQICSTGTFGFVLERDLQRALQAQLPGVGKLPPSVHPNPVPVLKP